MGSPGERVILNFGEFKRGGAYTVPWEEGKAETYLFIFCCY